MKKILAVAMLLVCFAGTVMADGSGPTPPKRELHAESAPTYDAPTNR
jgi:hypothetical protein